MQTERLKTDNRRSWREYQNSLKTPDRIQIIKRWAIFGILTCVALLGLYKGIAALTAPAAPSRENRSVQLSQPFESPEQTGKETLIAKKDVQLLVEQVEMGTLLAKQVRLPFHSQEIQLVTSLDPDLQTYLLNAMDRKNSRYIGIVAMDAKNGRILALAGYNKIDPAINPCLISTYPAASIFKIVTAAAAVDRCGYNADTVMQFNGYKHTLYKKQLTEKTNRYTNKVSFKDSFAQSVNPVFGKIGTLYLKKAALDQYAQAFGFNRPIDFELPVAGSHINISPKPYHWAEIASGFNNDTTISPLHGAIIASTVLNQGRMISPTIVDHITDAQGKLLYRSRVSWEGRAMSAKASGVLERLMETTIQSGTGRKSFRDRRRHSHLVKAVHRGKNRLHIQPFP